MFTARIEPTIFYRQTPKGLSEAVEVFIAAAALPATLATTLAKTANVELVVGGHSYEQPFTSSNEFGE